MASILLLVTIVMAIRKMTEGVSSWTRTMPFPRDKYQIRCTSEEFGVSSGDNPMITREFEILSPDTVPLGDRMVSVGGKTVMQWRVCKVRDDKNPKEWDLVKSDKAFGQLRDELLLAGWDPDEDIDDENPPLFFKDKVFDAILYGKEDVSRRAPTPEQLKKGQKFGDAIKDANGKEIRTYQIQIDQILGLSTTDTNKPY